MRCGNPQGVQRHVGCDICALDLFHILLIGLVEDSLCDTDIVFFAGFCDIGSDDVEIVCILIGDIVCDVRRFFLDFVPVIAQRCEIGFGQINLADESLGFFVILQDAACTQTGCIADCSNGIFEFLVLNGVRDFIAFL